MLNCPVFFSYSVKILCKFGHFLTIVYQSQLLASDLIVSNLAIRENMLNKPGVNLIKLLHV